MNTVPKRSQSRWLVSLVALALGVGTLVVYLPARHHEFLNWDDVTYVTANDHVKGGVTWEGVVWAFTRSYSANWHPLTWFSHMVDCQLFGLNAGAHHLVNVGFHTANTLLLFGFLRFVTSAFWRSAFVAGLFALHPLHVESVAWLAERKDVLSTLFFFLTLWTYAAYVKSKVIVEKRRVRSSKIFYLLSLLLFALGLMSKPMLVTLPFVLLLLDYWPLGRFQASKLHPQSVGLYHLVPEKLPFFAMTIASSIVTYLAQKQGGAVASFEKIPFAKRIANAAVAYIEYLLKFLWPMDLSPIYPLPAHWEWWRVAGSALMLALLTGVVWRWRRRFPYALTGWLWFLGTLVPVIGIVQVGSQSFADRYTYIPLVGIMVAVVWMGAGMVEPMALWKKGHLSPALSSKGGEGEAAHPSPFSRRYLPVVIVLLIVFATLAWRSSEQLVFWKSTETLFRHTLVLAPNSVQAMYGLGSDLIESGQVEAGKRLLLNAIRLQPDYAEALGTMGNELDGEGRYEEAVRYFQDALKAQPDNTGVLNNLAWLRASSSDAKFRDGPEAVRLATRACELTRYERPLFVGTLAAAQAEAGDFPSAITTAEGAAALAGALKLEETARKNRELIELYRQGKAAHGGPPSPHGR